MYVHDAILSSGATLSFKNLKALVKEQSKNEVHYNILLLFIIIIY